MPRDSLPHAVVASMMVTVILAAACGGENTSNPASEDTARQPETTAAIVETTSEEKAYNPNAEIGPKEKTNMIPADGKKPDEPQPLPEDPPKGVKTYPATTNKLVEGKIEYDRVPPTNGNHSPMWQNCGVYSEPIQEETAVHSLDHGVVWITYRPDLPADQVERLRAYGGEEYVIVSPYPDLPAPVVATAWRNQIYLRGADDPRLREFVDGFRISEIAPLSGNRCTGGVGKPDA